MTHLKLFSKINGPAGRVWEIIRDFGTVGDYVAGITGTRVEGEGVGAIRKMRLVNGGEVVERLEKLDEANRSLSYSVLETPLPMEGYLATMTVKDSADGRCELTWESTFRVTQGRETAVKKIIERLYRSGFDGLGHLLGKKASRMRKTRD